MKTFLKLAAFAVIVSSVAAADGFFSIYDSEASQQAALAQFEDSDGPAREMRARSRARPAAERLIWLTVPVAAVLLFAGDLVRVVTASK